MIPVHDGTRAGRTLKTLDTPLGRHQQPWPCTPVGLTTLDCCRKLHAILVWSEAIFSSQRALGLQAFWGWRDSGWRRRSCCEPSRSGPGLKRLFFRAWRRSAGTPIWLDPLNPPKRPVATHFSPRVSANLNYHNSLLLHRHQALPGAMGNNSHERPTIDRSMAVIPIYMQNLGWVSVSFALGPGKGAGGDASR